MEPEIRLDLCSASGVKFAEVTDFLELSAVSAVNMPGNLKTSLRGNHPALASLENNSHVELYYKYSGGSWTKFWGGLYRAQERRQPQEPIFQLTAVGYLWMLNTRIIAYPSNTSGKTYFPSDSVETIMKTLVAQNITSAATTANGRIRAGTAWPATVISVEADSGLGASQEWWCAQDLLLESLQKLAAIGGGDFNLVKTAANAFEFRFYDQTLGTDRIDEIVFSLGYGNLKEPVYSYNRMREVTAVVVGGQGEEASREFVTRTGADYGAANDIEGFVSATEVEVGNTDGLNAFGDQQLSELRAREEYEFGVIQTPACRFGVEYFLGDLVTAVNPYTGVSSTQKIAAVTMNLGKRGDVVFVVEMETPDE